MLRRAPFAIAAILFVAHPARAQDEAGRTASFGWVRLPGAESCPSAQAIAQATESVLGRDAFVSAADASLAIEGRVEARAGGFRATLAVSDAAGASVGERVVEADGACDSLLSPLSIVLAILVDPDATPTSPPSPPPPPDPIIETRIVTERVEVPVVVRSPPWRLELDLGGLFDAAATPFVSGGGELYVFLTPPGFVPIGIHGWLVPISRADYGAGQHVDQLTSWAGISICPLAAHDASFSVAACAGLDVGGVFVVGQSGAAPSERERITGGLDVSVRGRLHVVGPLWIVLSAALLVPFRNEPFRDAMMVPYYGPEPLAFVATLGPSFAFDL